MKKRHLNLSKKLLLNKEIVSGLNTVTGGGLTDTCPADTLCIQPTFQQSCVAQTCFCSQTLKDCCATQAGLTCVGCPPPLTQGHSCWQDGQTNCI